MAITSSRAPAPAGSAFLAFLTEMEEAAAATAIDCQSSEAASPSQDWSFGVRLIDNKYEVG